MRIIPGLLCSRYSGSIFFLVLFGRLIAEPINQTVAVPIGGIRQWISIKCTDDKGPVLLFLHGGPGNSMMRYAEKFTNTLQKHFVVVQWDQRESGQTAKLNPSDKELTISLIESDAVEMVRYLQARFSKENIYLAGHSWGGFLALRIAASHPELLIACIAIAPMVNQWQSERGTLDWLMNKAKTTNNREAIDELSLVNIPFGNPDQLYYHRRWLQVFEQKKPFSRNYIRNWGKKWFAMYTEACNINLFESVPQIKCPVYFFLGSTDRQASSTITEAYYQALQSEKKDLFWFTNSGHNLNLAEPKKFQETIISLATTHNNPK